MSELDHDCKFTRLAIERTEWRQSGDIDQLEQRFFRVKTCRVCGRPQPARRSIRRSAGTVRKAATPTSISTNDETKQIAKAVLDASNGEYAKLSSVATAARPTGIPRSNLVRGLDQLLAAGLIALEYTADSSSTPRRVCILAKEKLEEYARPGQTERHRRLDNELSELRASLVDAVSVHEDERSLAPLSSLWRDQLAQLSHGQARIQGQDGRTLLTSRSARYGRTIAATLCLARAPFAEGAVDEQDQAVIEEALGEPITAYGFRGAERLDFSPLLTLRFDPERPPEATNKEENLACLARILVIVRDGPAFQALMEREIPDCLIIRARGRPTPAQTRVLTKLSASAASTFVWPELEPVGLFTANETLKVLGTNRTRLLLADEKTLAEAASSPLSPQRVSLAQRLAKHDAWYGPLASWMAANARYAAQSTLVDQAEDLLRESAEVR